MQNQDNKIQKLQKDLTFYINKANSLEHNLAKSQFAQNPATNGMAQSGHDDAKMSKSYKVRRSQVSPFRGADQGPVD